MSKGKGLGALRNLAVNADNKKEIVRLGGSPLIELLEVGVK